MRAALLALALLPSAAFGEQCTRFVMHARFPMLFFCFDSRHLYYWTFSDELLVRAVHAVDNALRLTHDATPVRVQNTSNQISWTYTQGDPTSVDIIVNNSNNQTLNGNFSIARNVPVSQEVCLALFSLSMF
jgi:hypothetical protein